MNIELSREEYRYLMDILHIADVIMVGHRHVEDKRTEAHRLLVQKLYALAERAGLEGLTVYQEHAGRRIPTPEFEQSSVAHSVIDDFSEHLFWDGLISRLVARDAAQIAAGNDRLNALNETERQNLEGPIRQRYIDEFAANGVTNLEIIMRLDGGATLKTSD